MHAIFTALFFLAALIDYTFYVILPLLIAVVTIFLLELWIWFYYTAFLPFVLSLFMSFVEFIESVPYLP